MEPTNITKLRKVFCPTHKAAFDAPSQSRVVCEIVEHILTDNFARAEYWEYCCNCQTYWPSRLGQSGPAAIDCPSCGRDFARRYLCHECKLLSVESDEAAKGKIHSITTLGISPNCPNCGNTAPASIQEHRCEEAQALLLSADTTCRLCEVLLVKAAVTPPTLVLGPPCPNCGAYSELGSSYCMSCGDRLSFVAPNAPVFSPLPEIEPNYNVLPNVMERQRPVSPLSVAVTATAAHWYQSHLKLGGIIVAALLLITLSLYGVSGSKTAAKLDEAITKGNLLSPPGANAFELYHQLKTEGVSREKLAQAESRLLPLVTPRPKALLQYLTTPGGEEPRVEEWADAAKMLEWASEMSGNDSAQMARAIYCQGRVAYLSNRRSEAIQIWQRANDMDKSWAVPANSIGLAYNETKDYGTARSYLFQATKRAPAWAFPYNNIGTSYYFENNLGEATSYYQKAIECDSNWGRPHAWLGTIALKQQDCTRAVTEFEQVLSSAATGNEKMDLDKIEQQLTKARDCSVYEGEGE